MSILIVQYRLFILSGCRLDLSFQYTTRKLRDQAFGINIFMSAAYWGSQTSYLSSISLKSPSTQSSSYHQFYSIIMEKSSNHQLLNSKISISRFPKFSISTAFKAHIHQIISQFRPNLQPTGKPKPPLIAAQCNCLGDMELISFPLLRGGCILVPEPLIKKLRPLYFYNF